MCGRYDNLIAREGARPADGDCDALADAGVGPGNECLLPGQRFVIGHGGLLA
jgi:hypothetical protein